MTKLNTALLIIDVINSCAHENCERPELNIYFSKLRKMVPNLKKFIADFRAQVGGYIIFVKTTPWQKKFLTDNINELYTDSAARYYSNNDSGFPEEFY